MYSRLNKQEEQPPNSWSARMIKVFHWKLSWARFDNNDNDYDDDDDDDDNDDDGGGVS